MAINFEPQFDFTPETPKTSSMGDVAKEAIRTALPQPNEAMQPLAPTSNNPIIGGAQAALQTLKDPTRISSTLSAPGQIAGQKVEQATAPSIGQYPAKAAGFATSVALDPQSYLGFNMLKSVPEEVLAEEAGSHTGFFSKLVGTFKKKPTADEISTATENLRDTLSNTRTKLGQELEQVKAKAGIPKLTEKQEVTALANAKNKASSPTDIANEWLNYRKTAPQYAPKMEETGMDVNALKQQIEPVVKALGSKPPTHPELPTIPVDAQGNTPIQGPHALYIGSMPESKYNPNLDMYDVRNSSLNSATNQRLTLTGDEGLQRLQDANIPIVGKDPRAGSATPQTAYGHLFKPDPNITNVQQTAQPQDIQAQLKAEFDQKISQARLRDLLPQGSTIKFGPSPEPKPTFNSPGDELQYLIDMKQRLGESIKPSLSADGSVIQKASNIETRQAKVLANQIDDRMQQVPGGDAVVAQNKKYSQIAQVFGDLQKQLSKPGQSEDFLRRILLSKSGRAADYRASLGKLEQISGKPILSDLTEMFKAQQGGLSMEELKHPFASAIRSGLPRIGDIIQGPVRKAATIGAFPTISGMKQGFPLGQDNQSALQSVRDRLNAQ